MPVRRILWFGRNLRARKRYQEVLAVLIKVGFDDVVRRIRPPFFLRRVLTGGTQMIEERGPSLFGSRLRLALEELGATTVKFGQILSTRPDLLPPTVIDELQKLQDSVQSFPFEEIRSKLEENQWGRRIPEIFAHFDTTPLAAASIAQIHRARTKDGREVVVKIRRPGIAEVVETDLVILETLARLILRTLPESEAFDPIGLVEHFGKSIRRELDFTQEGRNLDRFASLFRDDETYRVPKVHWDLTTSSVLVLEYIDGVKVSDKDGIRQRGLDPAVLAERGANAILKQVLRHGIFHADPHPGNLLVLENNVVCPVDYGLVGRLDEITRSQLIDMLRGIGEQDVDRVCQNLIDMGGRDPQGLTRELQVDVDGLLDRFSHAPLGRIPTSELAQDFLSLLYRHRLMVPPDVLLLFKALTSIERVAVDLNPDFDMVATIEPFIKEVVRERLSPKRIATKVVKLSEDVTDLVFRLPRETGEIIDLVRRNRLRIGFDHRGLRESVAELDRTGNRIVVGMIASALVVASALTLHLDVGPTLFGYPALGVVIMTIALLMGMRLAFAIYRSGKL